MTACDIDFLVSCPCHWNSFWWASWFWRSIGHSSAKALTLLTSYCSIAARKMVKPLYFGYTATLAEPGRPALRNMYEIAFG
jgi:hypothetical protein